MNLWGTFRIALRALSRNKLRSSLTMLGIIIGVAAVIAIVALGQGASASVSSQLQGLGTNLLTIMPGSSSSFGARGGAGSATSLKPADAPSTHSITNLPVTTESNPFFCRLRTVCNSAENFEWTALNTQKHSFSCI